jgi:hypothetical protein
MKNRKGQANFIGMLFFAIIFMVLMYVGVSSLGAVYSANTNGCVFDENNTLHNCSQSDFAYYQQNKTMETMIPMINVGTNMIWLLVLGVFIAVTGLIYKAAGG